MKARLVFYLDVALTEEQRSWLDRFKGSDKELWDWLRSDGKLAKMGLNEGIGWLKWDKRRQQLYSTEGNGKLFSFTPSGFELPDFMVGFERRIVEVQAYVYFQTEGRLTCGQYIDKDTNDRIRGTLDFERLPDGRSQYVLIIHGAKTLEELGYFADALRTGTYEPDGAWK